MRPRSAAASGDEFPYRLPTMCYIEQTADGSLAHGFDAEVFARARTGESRLYAVWPGRYASHLFVIDDLDALGMAFGLVSDEAVTGLARHRHDVEWRLSPLASPPVAGSPRVDEHAVPDPVVPDAPAADAAVPDPVVPDATAADAAVPGAAMPDPAEDEVAVEVRLRCGCRIRDLAAFAEHMREQLGWEVSTTVGWQNPSGSGEPPTPEDPEAGGSDPPRYTVAVRRAGLDAPVPPGG